MKERTILEMIKREIMQNEDEFLELELLSTSFGHLLKFTDAKNLI
jgi:hypothetical protein